MPIEKDKYAPRGSSYAVQEKFREKQWREAKRSARQTLKLCSEIRFDSDEQPSDWQNAVAFDLNKLLYRGEQELRTAPNETNLDFAKTVLRIIKRVAEFEGIRRSVKAPLTPANCPVCIRRAK